MPDNPRKNFESEDERVPQMSGIEHLPGHLGALEVSAPTPPRQRTTRVYCLIDRLDSRGWIVSMVQEKRDEKERDEERKQSQALIPGKQARTSVSSTL